MGRPFSSSYLAGDPAAAGFLARDFRDAATRVAAARAAAARTTSATVLAVLAEQQAELAPSAARDANLAALARGGAAVVATGQQVGLFLGPLYSFYKAASAIAAARALEAASGVRTIPLFWLQTEDHDFAEIATCHAAGPRADDEPVTLTLAPEDAHLARVSLAHRRLGSELATLVEQLAAVLGPGAAADEVVSLLRAHYTSGRSPARAFAGVLATIFADEGLLILDPRDARLAGLAAPIYRRALDDDAALEAALRARAEALVGAGLDAQIPLRAGCSLVFFHQRDAAGPRFRLQRAGASWSLAGAAESLADGDVRRALDDEPLRFSTSALLRPIVQDTLLPVAATVGGPAEVSYFAQLGPLYDHFGLAQPLVIPRARFAFVDAATRRRLQQLGLTANAALRPRAELLPRLATSPGAAGPEPGVLRRQIAEQIAPAVEQLTGAALASNAGLSRPAARTRESVAHALERFVTRYARERLARDAVVPARLDKIQRALLPGGVPQERFFGWPTLAARVGASTLKQLAFERLDEDPFATRPRELWL